MIELPLKVSKTKTDEKQLSKIFLITGRSEMKQKELSIPWLQKPVLR
jgi:hypothetical protein